ncbi:hypothetical protein FOMPIDRAFT_83398 [Fomitopsis schrenkii]|uniref:F-box domain-containing protein n=1 Tax=Fomitopsis schrenkii TaxID=2126942 RepID=S8EDV5_FOMSC|nr:hypothetical protein FOMPIDRAFT_83398 [Fomitopsis schrenkii]
MTQKKVKRAKSPQDASNLSASATTSTRTRKKGARSGRLKDMLIMPLDVLHEIFMCFLPQDLLSLSRTSKAFHEILLRKSSGCYWKEALGRIEGPPPCPKELIEPAWVALLYSRSTCTECGNTSKLTEAVWPFLMRLCGSCRPGIVIEQTPVYSILMKYDLPNDIITEIKGYNRKLGGPFWLRSEVDEVLDGWRRLKRSASDIPGWEAFVKERSERVKALQAFQHSCLEWAKVEDAREQRIRDERYKFIASKLEDIGWGAELKFLEWDLRLKRHKLVEVAKPLTDRKWRKVYKGLMKFMESIREERLAHDTCMRISHRWRTLSDVGPILVKEYLDNHPEMQHYGLNTADLVQTPEFREIMYAPEDAVVNEDIFMALRPKMDAIVEEWVSQKREQLREMVLSKTKLPDDVDPLALATTIFTCKKCFQRCLFFLDVLKHPCQRPMVSVYSPEQVINAGRGIPNRRYVGKANPLTFSLCEYEYSEPACRVVRLCGQDPQRTTVNEMDALDVRLVQADSIMTWRRAIIEQTRLNYDISSWRMADEEEVGRAKQAETKTLQPFA